MDCQICQRKISSCKCARERWRRKDIGTDGEKEGEKEEVGEKGGGDNSVERN